MLTFILRRLLLAVPVLLGVVFVVMLTIDLLPGDAVTLMLGEHATKDAVARLREHLGLDKPFLVRYLDYVGQLVRGDLGRSIQQNRPVAAELADAWPATLRADGGRAAPGRCGRHRRGRGLGGVAELALRRGGAARLAVRAVDADLLDRPRADRRLLAVAQLAAGGRGRLADAPGAAGRHAGAAVGGDDRAPDALGRARRAARGLRAHRAGQGRGRGCGCSAATPCATPSSRSSRWSVCSPVS